MKNASAELDELIVRLDIACTRCMEQLNFLKRMRELVNEEHLQLQEQALHILVGKLEIANGILKLLVVPDPRHLPGAFEPTLIPKRIKYSVKKDSILKAIQAIETWQTIADPQWLLMLRMSDQRVDTELRHELNADHSNISAGQALTIRQTRQSGGSNIRGLARSSEEFKHLRLEIVAFSEARLAYDDSHTLAYVLDVIECPQKAGYDIAKKNVRELAARLSTIDQQTCGLLLCKGFVTQRAENSGSTSFTLIFGTMKWTSAPRSLRDLLLNLKAPASLSHKFSIAQQLARSVSDIHAFGFVHKNVRPETILITDHHTTDLTPSSFLVGFGDFRKEEGKTNLLGDDTFEKNLYRHATRQGSHPETDYIMQHDIYSLGVCLLEVGIWQSLVLYQHQAANTGNPPTTMPSTLLTSGELAPLDHTKGFLMYSAKQKLVDLAHQYLPERMGTKYMNIVATCLTCLDENNPDFGNAQEFQDEDEIRIGSRYIEKVSSLVLGPRTCADRHRSCCVSWS
jgi:serine/threonine protein kinase